MNRTEYTQELNSFNRKHSYAYSRPNVGSGAVQSVKHCNNTISKEANLETFTIKNRIELIGAKLTDKEFINQNIARAEEWLEVDDKAMRVEGEKKKIPAHLVSMIAVICAALMLIVSGAVLRSKATMELYAAENELKRLQAVQSELEAELELKNDLRYIEMVAKEKLGMIERDHAVVCHIEGNTENKIEIYSPESGGTQEATLLDALSFLQ